MWNQEITAPIAPWKHLKRDRYIIEQLKRKGEGTKLVGSAGGAIAKQMTKRAQWIFSSIFSH